VESILTRETVGNLAIMWTKPGAFAPSVVGDTAFVGGAIVAARRVDTGARLWRMDIGGPVWFTPAYSHGIVVAGAYRYERGDTVSGLDASSGALLWTRPLHGHISSPPSISGGTVYIGYSKAAGNGVAALNLRNGGIRWRWTSPDPTYVSSPTTDGTSVYFSFEGGTHVVSLDAATGAVRWDEVLDSGGSASSGMVSLQGDRVFAVNVAGNLYALDAATGGVIWKKFLNGLSVCPITTTPRTLFVTVSSRTLLALSTADGSMRWMYSSPSNMPAAAAVAGGVVYTGSRHSRLLAFNSRTGKLLADMGFGSGTTPSIPSVSNGRVFVSEGGKLMMLSLPASVASHLARPSRRPSSSTGGTSGGRRPR
jgi:outer membrane protein assembly factor BamB